MPHGLESAAGGSIVDLVVRARMDRGAFGRLYDMYYPGIYRYCLRRLFVRTLAEEATADVFLHVAEKMRSFGGTCEEDFSRWVYRIATNEANAQIRRDKRYKAMLQAAARNREAWCVVSSCSTAKDTDRLDWPAVHQAILRLS